MDMNDVKLMEKQIDEMLDSQKARQTYASGCWTMFRLAKKSCLKKDIALSYTQICQDVLALHHRNSVCGKMITKQEFRKNIIWLRNL